ncbi:MAG: NTP transferase domain-containing protein, partial [Thermocrispum sp.]
MARYLVILAAGKGERLGPGVPKPLRPVAGESMVNHVLRAGSGARPDKT